MQWNKETKQQAAVAAAATLGGVLAIQALRRWWRQPQNIPHQTRLGPLGHAHLILNGFRGYRLHDQLNEGFEEVKADVLWLDIPLLPPFIFTIDPKNVEYILKSNFDNYPKGPNIHSVFEELLGDGIFNADGPIWHSQRKTSSKMFTANKFKNHIWKVVEKNSAKVVSMLKSTPKGQSVDIFNLLNRFTLDSIGEIGFGADIRSLEKADSPFLESFDKAQQIILLRFVIPGWQALRLLRLGMESGSRRHFGLLRDYSREIVQNLKGSLDSEAGDSFVGLFMKSGEASSDKLLEDLVLNFLIAGRDTTAQAMGWCLWNIMQHVDVEQRILEEVEKVCGSGQLTYDMISKLDYLDAVIRESLRLHPSVPIDIKEATADDVWPDGSRIARGSTVGYSAYAMGRSKRLWGEDAAVFRPDRWLAMQTPPDAYTYTAFHAGPRECLGKRLAMVEMKALLLQIVKETKLTLAVPADIVRPDLQLTLGMSSGLRCYAAPR